MTCRPLSPGTGNPMRPLKTYSPASACGVAACLPASQPPRPDQLVLLDGFDHQQHQPQHLNEREGVSCRAMAYPNSEPPWLPAAAPRMVRILRASMRRWNHSAAENALSGEASAQ